MARRSVVVLDSFGRKVSYTTRKAAQADCDAGRAIGVSQGCIRLLPSSDGGEWRKKPSGGFLGAVVRQFERRAE